MSVHARKKPPIVRLPPKSSFELLLSNGARAAVLFVGLITFVFALHAGRLILEPITLGIVIGLMLGPVASKIESRGAPPALSSLLVVLAFLLCLCALAFALTAPLAFWFDRLPEVWRQLQFHLSQIRDQLNAIAHMRDQLRNVTGGSIVTVSVDNGSPVDNVAVLAPAVVAQIILFFAGMYFFVATRHRTRDAALRLCFDRRLRWRVAHIFRDVEYLVSRYLLSITVVNIGQGIAVTLALWAIGVPSPAIWGALAGVLNFVIYIGPAVMAVILLAVGVVSFDTLGATLLPVIVFLALHLIESQFVTPTVLGRTLTLNPFVIFLALAFWLWIWGPVGGFVAVPALLILYAIGSNIIPGMEWSAEAGAAATPAAAPLRSSLPIGRRLTSPADREPNIPAPARK
jgi:predicted PurR-regulated permease PerM